MVVLILAGLQVVYKRGTVDEGPGVALSVLFPGAASAEDTELVGDSNVEGTVGVRQLWSMKHLDCLVL